MNTPRLIAFFIALAGCTNAATPGIDFKGLRLGSTEAEVQTKFPNATCSDKFHPLLNMKVRECVDVRGSIAEVPAEVFFLLRDTRVAEIWAVFPSIRFDIVAATLQEKFGKPSFDGQQVGGRELLWERNGTDETVRAYAVYQDPAGENKAKSVVKFMGPVAGDDAKSLPRRSKDL